jgi:23S rRNA (uracil1939-C5)-methyltransferase
MERGQHLTLSLLSWGRLGEALAHHQGQDIFVIGGIPGEEVVAEVLRVRRKYVAAQVVQVLQASADRVSPPCPYYGACTGCQWQHLSYPAQLETKHRKVVDALERVGGFTSCCVLPVIPSPRELGYRNHARFTVNRGGELGFVHREIRQFIRIDHCLLMHEGINDLLTRLQGRCGETTQLSIRAGQETGDYLVQPTLKAPEIDLTTGQKHYLDSIDGRTFRVASPSFFQVNREQAARLAEVVGRALDLKGNEVLLDAYTGVGTFAIMLSTQVRRVLAVEESAAAVADARENARGLGNIDFILGKTEEVLDQLPEPPDIVMLDPPRAGCHQTALASLLRLGPPRIVYVSCDPETLARDLKLLCQGPYQVDQVEPLDMFPQTHHVECVAVLTRTIPSVAVVLASASPRRRELLADLGLSFQVMPADVDETPRPGETPREMVERLSLAKALAVAGRLDSGYVVGADSTVVHQGRAVGKPVDADDARRMLTELSGTQHQVTTGVTVLEVASGRRATDSLTSQIAMRELSPEEIEASVAGGTPLDKAGAYAIQDEELRPGRLTEGCYTNVVGLPLCRLSQMLADFGCPLPPRWAQKTPGRCQMDCPLQNRS